MAKITYLTQQTWEKVYEKENKEPSLTRTSDYIPIEELFAKFRATDFLMEQFTPIARLSPDEREVLENDPDIDDLADADLVEQKAFIDDVLDGLAFRQAESEKEKEAEPTQPKDEPEPPVKPVEKDGK